jgi:solute carrier family 40 (iron-regulated transporter), member 1
MTESSLSNRLLIGRFLTRSGDQAWDFAVPIVLLHLMPGQLRIAALYFLIIRIATVLLLPRLSMLIDRIDRLSSARIGMFLQLVGVVAGFFSVRYLPVDVKDYFLSLPFILIFSLLSVSGIVAQLGSSFMDIAIANDLVPSAIAPNHLPHFNSRLRQVDLATEVASPIAAGLLLLLATTNNPLLGFGLIALWNVVSFLPEYAILTAIFKSNPQLRDKPVVLSAATTSIFARLRNGWIAFFREPIAPFMIAYALLWLSVLSPHGVLLTAFLKDGWNSPEWMIGLFRGLGAVFGLAATVLFPMLLRLMSWGLDFFCTQGRWVRLGF